MLQSKLDEFQPGDHVEWAHRHYGGDITKLFRGKIRAVKSQDGYEYAVVETEPYGHLLMPSLAVLKKVELVAEVAP